VLLLCGGGGCARSGAALSRFEYRQLHMGVQARLVVYAENPPKSEDACRDAYARVAQFEDIFSDYRPGSEAMRLSAKSGGPPVQVSPELFEVLAYAVELSRKSDGAFDVTVGPLVQLWRNARKTKKLPTTQQIEQAKRSVGWRLVKLDAKNQTVQLLAPNMRLDFGGVAKGYAGDEVIKLLKSRGIPRAMFEAGGDIVVGDAPPGESGWTIELPGLAGEPKKVKEKHRGISTSGDTVQYVEFEGKRYSHVVDPRTGIALSDQFMATVIAPSGMASDALSTAMTVVGPEKARALAREYRVRAWVAKAP
jgi:thiamine biosynthesis lipoprotein